MLRSKIRNLKWLKDQLRLFKRLWKDVGPAVTLLWLLDHVCGRFPPFRILLIALFDRIDCLADHIALPEGYRIEPADPAILDALAARIPDELSRSFIANALEKGDRCFLLFHGQEVAAYQWYSTTPTRMFDGAWIHPPADRLYSYKDYVMPEFRGIRLHSLAKRSLASQLARSQLKGLVWFSDARNAASLLSAGKIPGQRFGFVLFRPGKSGLWSHASRACREANIRFDLY